MKALYAHPLTSEERAALQAGLKSRSGFTVRRSQALLMSAEEHLKAAEIGRRLGCSDQAVRESIHAFEAEGVACLEEKPRGRRQAERAFDGAGEARLRALLQQSPRAYGHETSLWTLDLLAEVCYAQGWTQRRVHLDTISATLQRLGIRWLRAKGWITSPDRQYAGKKSGATG